MHIDKLTVQLQVTWWCSYTVSSCHYVYVGSTKVLFFARNHSFEHEPLEFSVGIQENNLGEP